MGSTRHARSALVCLAAAAALACGGCVQPVSPEAKQLLADGKAAYDDGDDEAAIAKTGAFLAEHSKTNLADVAYYVRGLARLRAKQTSGAKTDLQMAAATTDKPSVRLGASKALGDLVFDSGDAEYAEKLYRQALADAQPRTPPADEIRYRLGCTLQRRGRWSEADEQFDHVVHVFQGSEVARRAERRLRCVAWTVQAGAFDTKALADAEVARLHREKIEAVTRATTDGGKLRFVVQVGRHETHAAAARTLPIVRRASRDALVTVTR